MSIFNINNNEPASDTLLDRIAAEIIASGPIKLSSFMQYALSDPNVGYYQSRDPFGTDGDFTTAPEISGLFGQMCGLYLAHMAEMINNDNFVVLELGPGRGSLMADMRHVWKQIMPSLADTEVHLVETSPHLRQLQANRLGYTKITFHADLPALPPRPLLAIANEFFDALPIDQAVWRSAIPNSGGGGAWHHRLVGLLDGRLGFVDGNPIDDASLAAWQLVTPSIETVSSGDKIAEFCAAGETIMRQLGSHIAAYGGACLIIDYGCDGQTGDSLQAVANHKPVDAFYQPGAADLSHWVDFSALRRAAITAGVRLIGPVTQGNFLREIGVMQRAEAVAKFADAEARRGLFAAVDRLISNQHMGSAFKVALLVPKGDGVPPGFTTLTDREAV